MNGSFGHWLKQRRKSLDLTQAELADQVGCSTMTIRKIEADDRRPSKQISERMADVLAISLEERTAFLTFARRTKPSLLEDFTALTPTNNLPTQLTSFIGREHELALIHDRLKDSTCRLLTLVGPGGIGKTRLAVQAAEQMMGSFADGVYFVSLTPVDAPSFMASVIAGVLQMSFYGQDNPNTQLVNYLRGKHMLLVLDNFEHLLEGVELLADMLANAPRLKLLVTSRERLNVQQEWVLPVEGLPYPLTREMNGDLNGYSAAELFSQTARRLQPKFSLRDHESSVIDICRAVEGMPLGIELAATWLRVMPCEQIASQIRLDLDFLATPLRNVEPRHQSLRAVFEHSWGLLVDNERAVLMKLSVFRGGVDLEAAEQVAGASLPLLASLLDKSLIRLNAAGRYDLHELLRQFAAEKLRDASEMDATQRRHFLYFLKLAEQLELRLFGPVQLASMDRMEIEQDNFRAALAWLWQEEEVESGLRLAGALGWFWNRRAYSDERLEWLKKFLAAGEDAPVSLRAKAFHHVIEISARHGYGDLTNDHQKEVLKLAAEVEDLRIKAWLLASIGFRLSVDWREHLGEALELFRKIDDQWGITETVGRLAWLAFHNHDFARGRELYEEAIRVARRAGDKGALAYLVTGFGCQNWYEGKIDHDTEHLWLEGLELFREMGYKGGMAWTLFLLGKISHFWGEDERARAFLEAGFRLSQKIGNQRSGINLIYLGKIFCDHNEPIRGVRLLGAMHDLIPFFTTGSTLESLENKAYHERCMAAAHAQLDDASFVTAYAEGQRMTIDEAAAYALGHANEV